MNLKMHQCGHPIYHQPKPQCHRDFPATSHGFPGHFPPGSAPRGASEPEADAPSWESVPYGAHFQVDEMGSQIQRTGEFELAIFRGF